MQIVVGAEGPPSRKKTREGWGNPLGIYALMTKLKARIGVFQVVAPRTLIQVDPMSTKGEHKMHRCLLILLAAASSLTLGFGQESKSPQGWTAKTIQWQSTSPDGTKWAVLEGKSDVPGQAFTYAAFVPAGYTDHHAHSSDARGAVIQGALKVGFGPNPSHLETYPVGSFLFVPADVEHTMAADEDTILIGTAVGPWATHHHDHQDHQNH